MRVTSPVAHVASEHTTRKIVRICPGSSVETSRLALTRDPGILTTTTTRQTDQTKNHAQEAGHVQSGHGWFQFDNYITVMQYFYD